MPKLPPQQPAHAALPSAADQALRGAIVALQMRRPDEAEQIAASVLKANRGHAAAAGILARALMMLGRPDEAITPLKRAVRLTENPGLETQLASALDAAGHTGEALEQLRRTAARRPPFLPAFLQHAVLLGRAGDYASAIAVLEDGIALLPAALELQVELAFMHVKRNDRAAARSILSNALATAPQHPRVLASLAQVIHLDGDYDAAAEIYRRALAVRPDDAAARRSLGACLLEMGAREEGEETLRAAVRLAPQLGGQAIISLGAASHGRFFLRPSAAEKFLRGRRA